MLQGKNAVVTGCMRGIGLETMRCFAEHGANIWACAQHEDETFLQEVAALQEQYGVWIRPIYFDLLDEVQIKAGVKAIMQDKKPVDILVNIAGMTHNALSHRTTMDAIRKVFAVDFFSQMLASQMITKLMLRNGGGSVVSVSSITGLDGNPGQVAYAAAKGALISATKTMAKELGANKIRVNAVAPGVIDTAMTQALTEEQRNELLRPADLPRLGTPREVANVIAFLASDRASYITGQIVRIDGGIG